MAPARTAPEASVTVPTMEAVSIWARAGSPSRRTRTTAKHRVKTPGTLAFIFLLLPSKAARPADSGRWPRVRRRDSSLQSQAVSQMSLGHVLPDSLGHTRCADPEHPGGNRIEGRPIADEMEGAVGVHEGLPGPEGGRGRAGFQLVEAPEGGQAGTGRAVVVAVDHVAGVGLLLGLPHAVHVVPGPLRLVVVDEGQQARGGAVAAEDLPGARRPEADLAAALAVALEHEVPLVLSHGQPVGRDLAEVGVVDDEAGARGLERDQHVVVGGRRVHGEDADREHAALADS